MKAKILTTLLVLLSFGTLGIRRVGKGNFTPSLSQNRT